MRKATLQDIHWLRPLWEEWFQEDPVPFYTEEQALEAQVGAFQAAMEDPLRAIVLVEPREAALLWMSVGDPREIHDMGVYVRKDRRASGLGTGLTFAALRLAKEQGFQRVVISPLESNPRTKKWLGENGFRVHQTVMVKEL